jgi:hypothetical protein
MKTKTDKQNLIKSNIQRIEILLGIYEPMYVKELLINFFLADQSPTYPVSIIFTGLLDRVTGKADTREYKIIEYSPKEEEPATVLAEITINPFPSTVMVFIKTILEDDSSWEKVKVITKAIIEQMERLEYKIKSVVPDELSLKSSSHPWEQIEDNGVDREILKLWHKGLTNKEISGRLAIAPRSATNIISMLRGKYGEKIVPTNEDRRKTSLSKIDDSA